MNDDNVCPCCSLPEPDGTAWPRARMQVLGLVREICVPVGPAWSIVGDFGGVHRWIADMRATVVGKGVGAIRMIAYPDGRLVRERLEAFDAAGRRISYGVIEGGVLPVGDPISTIQLRPGEDPAWTVVEWTLTARYDPSADLAVPVASLAARTLMRIDALRLSALQRR